MPFRRRTANQYGPSGTLPGSVRNPLVLTGGGPPKARVMVAEKPLRHDPAGFAVVQVRRGEWAAVVFDSLPPSRADVASAWWAYRRLPAEQRPPIVTTLDLIESTRRMRVVQPTGEE